MAVTKTFLIENCGIVEQNRLAVKLKSSQRKVTGHLRSSRGSKRQGSSSGFEKNKGSENPDLQDFRIRYKQPPHEFFPWRATLPPSKTRSLFRHSHFLSGEGLTVHALEFLGVRFFSRVKDKVDRGGCFTVVKLIVQLSRCSNILTFSGISNRYLREFWTTLRPARMAFPSIVLREILIEYQSNFNSQSKGRKISQGAKEKSK